MAAGLSLTCRGQQPDAIACIAAAVAGCTCCMTSARHWTLPAETGPIATPSSTQSNRVTAKMSAAAFRTRCREFIVNQLSLRST